MQVKIIEPSSYCFGVKRAIQLVEQVLNENLGKNIFLFGELVHNQKAMEPLLEKGIKVINFSKKTAEIHLNNFISSDIVIFSAHGHDKKYEDILNKKGVKFYDATCPIVQANLNRIKKAKEQVIFIGKENHPETMASLSYNQNAVLYDIKNGMDYKKITSENVQVMNQTTLSYLELEDIFLDIKKHFKNSKFNDEICNASRVRQENIMSLDDSYDLVIIVGDKKSSNTTKLYELSCKNKNHDTYFISDVHEISYINLSKYKKCAIFSGTSCPETLINEIKEKIEELTNGKI